MNLYWVTTEDHAEDWFIVANNPQEAATFHEEMEGYDPGDATAEMILEGRWTMTSLRPLAKVVRIRRISPRNIRWRNFYSKRLHFRKRVVE